MTKTDDEMLAILRARELFGHVAMVCSGGFSYSYASGFQGVTLWTQAFSSEEAARESRDTEIAMKAVCFYLQINPWSADSWAVYSQEAGLGTISQKFGRVLAAMKAAA